MTTPRRRTHKSIILEALRRGEVVSPEVARREWRCMRLAARIHDLRKAGHVIVSLRGQGADTEARYFLIDSPEVRA